MLVGWVIVSGRIVESMNVIQIISKHRNRSKMANGENFDSTEIFRLFFRIIFYFEKRTQLMKYV